MDALDDFGGYNFKTATTLIDLTQIVISCAEK